MPKYNSYNYHQTTLVSVDLEKPVPSGSLEFTIYYLVDNEIDLIGLDFRYKNDDEGRFYTSEISSLRLNNNSYDRSQSGDSTFNQIEFNGINFDFL
jgi:hypothetical protein